MKKKGLVILSVLLVGVLAWTLSACSGEDASPKPKAATSVGLVNTTLRTDYIVGERLDLSGAKLSVVYDDGSEEVVAVTPDMVSGFDTASVGEKSAAVAYASLKTKYYYRVAAARAEPDYYETLENADGSLTVLSVKQPCPDTIFLPGKLGGKAVKTIASEAFSAAAASRIIIEEGVTDISSEAFANNPDVDFITLPDSVTALGEYAFWGCSSLEEVTLGKGITELSKGVFYECLTLVRVTLPASLETVGIYAFYNCTALDTIDLPQTVTSVEVGAFWNCKVLKSVSLPSVTEIKDNAFRYCSALAFAELPKVTAIGNNAFERTAFTAFDFPAGLVSIGDKAFSDVPLESILLAEGLKTLGANVFESANDETVQEVFLPASLETMGDSCFFRQGSLKTLEIAEPSALTVIPDRAFGGCAMLKSFKVPSLVTTIGNGAFDSAGYLLEGDDFFALDLSAARILTTINPIAFRGAKITGTLNIPKTVTFVGNDAFSNTKIDALVFPADSELTDANNLAYGQAFASNCRNLTKIVLPPVAAYKTSWTSGLGLTEIDLSNTRLTELAYNFFNGHQGLATVRLPATVTSIKNEAFAGANISQIFYGGTQSAWQAVTKQSGWDSGLAAGYTVTCADDAA